ncbi:MAG TPA: iron-sulfur cluster insertion protein ErpA [Herpetosiphonaceae bacterium]
MATIPLVDTNTLVTLTPTAAEKLQGLMKEKQLENHALRVFVAGGGCSGLQYGMTFDDETHPGDAEFEVSGLKVRVDPMSARYIQGANIDYQDSLMGGGFKIDNPNAVASCGCGSSFRPRDEEGYEDASAGGGCGSGGCGCGH